MKNVRQFCYSDKFSFHLWQEPYKKEFQKSLMVLLSAFVGLTFCLSQFLHFLFSYALIDSDASSSYL